MRIEEVHPVLVVDERGLPSLLAKVTTDKGITGLGEAGLVFSVPVVERAIEHLSGLVVGRDPWTTERLWQEMFRSGFFPADRIYTAAMGAIDVALWDIKAKAAGVPLYRLLGGSVRDKVPCYVHIQAPTVDGLLENAAKALEEGWRYLRWGPEVTTLPDIVDPGAVVSTSVEQFAKVREVAGDEVGLCFDVHTRLDPAHAITLCRELEPCRPYFVEDPIRSENPGSYRTLSRHVSVPLAAGEQWASKWQFREVVEEELVRYVRFDLGIVGGLTEALKITHWAETHYIDIAPHNPLGPVNTAASVALCMASSNVGVQEMVARPGTYAREIFPQQVQWEDGFASCPDVPGHGVELDESRITAPSGTLPNWPPRLRRPDGAFTNW